MRLRPSRRAILATGLAAGALPLLPRWAAAAGLDDRRAGALLARHPARHGARRWRGQPYAPAPVAGRGAARVDRLRPAQPDHLPQGRDALGRRAGGGEGALLPSRGATSRSRSRSASLEEGTARELLFSTDLFDMPEGHPARQARECRLRRVRGDGPGGEERLDGGARGVLLPHLGLFGAVRHVGARARDRLGRAGAGGVPALHPLLAGAGAGGRDRHLCAAREPAGDRGLPDGDGARRRGVPGHRGDALPARRRSTGWGLRR